ncbi:hypothetical protein ACMV5I_26750 [Serratia sp. T13T92]|uniref:hypothetical protein n=1 Tax=Serratia sp. T13T92 TaxID=3397496 RepID=UPI0039E14C9A
MVTRKSIDTVLLSVAANKLSLREWDRIKLMKLIDPPPETVVNAIRGHRNDAAALSRLQYVGNYDLTHQWWTQH